MIDCVYLGEHSHVIYGNRLCHHPQIHAAEAGIPARFCLRCPHREPMPSTLFGTLSGGPWTRYSVPLARDGDTWQGTREGVDVRLTRTGDSWGIEATIEGARQSVGALARVSLRPLVLHWRALGQKGGLDVIVTM